MINIKRFSIMAAMGAILLTIPLTVNANGLGENEPWKFRDANGIAAELLRIDLIERKKGGAFKNFGPGNTTVYNTQAIGNFNQTTIGSGACQGKDACTITSDQSNDDSPTTAIGVGNNSTTNTTGGRRSHND